MSLPTAPPRRPRPAAALATLLVLAACTDKPAETDDTAEIPTCSTAPLVTLLAPTEGATFAFGDTVPLTAEATSSAGESMVQLWAIDGDVVLVGATGSWTADIAGDLVLTFQAEDSCGLRQADVHITVTAPPDTGTDDTGGPDDTGVPPVEASATAYGAEVGLPTAATWNGLAIGPDGIVWGASSVGLVRFDPVAGTTRVYSTADGLTTDAPTAVLAHSDGTVWVGHLGTVDRQGEQLSVATDGTLTLVQPIDFTESTEILSVTRLQEQPYGVGAGDVWMGTNEGLCLYDADLAVFQEHAHPTHPHGYTSGVAFTAEGDIWNGDAYQLSRWRYSNDGDLSPSADLYETVPTWPVQIEEPVGIVDLDVDGTDLWVASSLFGVAHVSVGAEAGGSTVDLYTEPAFARAVRADGVGNVWFGTPTGLTRWDGAAMHPVVAAWVPADGVQQLAVDRRDATPALWLGTSAGLVRVVGVPE